MDLKGKAASAIEERERRQAAGKSNFNADRTRYITREFLGWVCYAGRVGDDKNFIGQRVGITRDEQTADRWLAGEEVTFDASADAFGNLR